MTNKKEEKAVWTGAVGEFSAPALDPQWPSRVLSELKKERRDLLAMAELELLLHAARELQDAEAGQKFIQGIGVLTRAPMSGQGDLKSQAQLLRLLWYAYAFTRNSDLGHQAQELAEKLEDELYDKQAGAFKNNISQSPYFETDANAMAAVAFLRAAAYTESGRFMGIAKKTLDFLIAHAYDSKLGMARQTTLASQDGRAFGFLSDNAWTMMALTEFFQMTGQKAYRDMADSLLKYLFQELWERERGGFLDRVARSDDAGVKAPFISAHLNAVAFEAAWRMHELKGNANYRKWIDWGLKGLLHDGKTSGTIAEQAALARMQDVLGRGRLDLELVGKLEDKETQGMLAELNRHYLPRRVVSFVDPDDQDYIMAHKLENERYPCLFICGADLRPVGRADSPEKVGAMLDLFFKASPK